MLRQAFNNVHIIVYTFYGLIYIDIEVYHPFWYGVLVPN